MGVTNKGPIVRSRSKGAFAILVNIIGIAGLWINPSIEIPIKHTQRLPFNGITHITSSCYSTRNDLFTDDVDYVISIKRKVEVRGPFKLTLGIDGTQLEFQTPVL